MAQELVLTIQSNIQKFTQRSNYDSYQKLFTFVCINQVFEHIVHH